MAAAEPPPITPSSTPRFSRANLRGAWWAWSAARRTTARLKSEGFEAALRLSPPPGDLPAEGTRGVRAALNRTHQTCLVRSIVMQRWLAAHGHRRDLIVGVKRPGEEFGAHAWLEGEPPHEDGPFHELMRHPA